MAGRLGRTAGIALALLAAVVPAADAALRAGDLLVSDDEGTEIRRINANTGNVTTFAEVPDGGTDGLAFTPAGRVVATSESEGAVYSIRKNGNVQTLVDEGLVNPFGVVWSAVDGILVADYDLGVSGSGQILRVRGVDDFVTVASEGFFEDPIGVAVSPSGDAHVIEQDFFDGDCGTSCGGVILLTEAGQDAVAAGQNFENPTDGFFAADGTLFVGDTSGKLIVPDLGTSESEAVTDPEIAGSGVSVGLDGIPLITTESGIAQIRNGALEDQIPLPGDSTDVAVVPPTCGGKWATVYGTPGRDTIKASPGDDVIAGLGGNDVIRGKDGKDILCGNAGKDKLNGGPAKDRAIGAGGNDRCRAERERSC